MSLLDWIFGLIVVVAGTFGCFLVGMALFRRGPPGMSLSCLSAARAEALVSPIGVFSTSRIVPQIDARRQMGELYDLGVVPGVVRPMALGFATNEILGLITHDALEGGL